MKDHSTGGLLAYDVTAKTLTEPVPGLKTLGRAQRGSTLGSRFIYRDADGIHEADLAGKTDRLVVPHPPSGRYNNVACRGTSCFVVRANNSADIWMRTRSRDESAMSLAAGSKLGPYEILGQIGAGGMGEVYRARDPRLGRDVAIKVLPASFSQDADRLRRFEQEARAAGVLNHPNITAVYDIGTIRRRRALRRPGAARGRDAARGSSPAESRRSARPSTTPRRSRTASRPRTRRASSTGT